jgi:hypothetical protein
MIRRHQVVKIEFSNNPKNLLKNLLMQFPNVHISL